MIIESYSLLCQTSNFLQRHHIMTSIYVVDYCHRYEAWYEKQVTAVGICDDGDWYIKVYDNQEDEETTIYANEMNLATNNIDWLLGIRDNICEILKNE